MSKRQNADPDIFYDVCIFKVPAVIRAPQAYCFIETTASVIVSVHLNRRDGKGVCKFTSPDNEFDGGSQCNFDVPISDYFHSYFYAFWTSDGKRLDRVLQDRGFCQEPRKEDTLPKP